MFKSNTDS